MGMSETGRSFAVDEVNCIQDYYRQQGYVVIKNLIAREQVAIFRQAYEKLKTSKFYFFPAQDTNRLELLSTGVHGTIEHSILNPLTLLFKPQFRQCVEEIVCAPGVAQILQALTGQEQHLVWQTMFFDQSTGTVAHQDHWYLDSDPPGHLVAGWFALEDIHPDSGPFFVVPGSHRGPLIARADRMSGIVEDHETFVQRTQKLIQEQGYQLRPMLLNAGDVLFWHPFLLHGAFENRDPRYSRKSFTAHYLPASYRMFQVEQTPPFLPSDRPQFLRLPEAAWWLRVKAYYRTILSYYRRQWQQRNGEDRPAMEMRSSRY